MTITSLVLFTHRKVMAFITHLTIQSTLLACNMYAIKRTSKLHTLTRVIPTPRTMHDNAIYICDWNTCQVCQYCCCGPELVPDIHDTTFYLHGLAVFTTLVMQHQKGHIFTNHLEESCQSSVVCLVCKQSQVSKAIATSQVDTILLVYRCLLKLVQCLLNSCFNQFCNFRWSSFAYVMSLSRATKSFSFLAFPHLL